MSHDRRLAARPRDPGLHRPQARLRDLGDPRPRLRGGGRATRSRSATGTSTPRSAYEQRGARSGTALAAGGVPRNELFLTTKLWRDEFAARPRAARRPRDSLERLQVDCVDLLLLHWPNDDVPLEETLGALAELREDGAGRALRRLELPRRHAARGARGRADLRRPGRVPPASSASRSSSTSRSRRTSWSPPTRRSPAARCPRTRRCARIGEALRQDRRPGRAALAARPAATCATIPKASSHERRRRELRGLRLRAQRRGPREDRRAARRTSASLDPRWAPDWDA